MITAELARERAAAGAAHFDKVRPGWFKAVDLDVLDMSAGNTCVSGQVFGLELFRWIDRRKVDIRHGLVLALGENDSDYDHNGYGPLTEAWRELIEERLQA